MPRCCVPGCDTGTSAEIVRTRKAKARNKSTFLLPADYGLFRKWEKVLGLKYDTDDGRSGRVCELHFDEADIIRYYYKQIENGVIQQFTFSRPTLKKGIIPLSTPRKEEFKPESNCDDKRKYKQKEASKVQTNKDYVSKKPCGRKRKSYLEAGDDYIINQSPKKSNARKNGIETKNYKIKNSSESDDEYIPNKRLKRNNVEKGGNAPKKYEKRTYKRQIRTSRNKIISSCPKKSILPIYNFDKLLHNLNRRNSKLPKGWEFSILNDDTVKFVYTPESSKYFLTCTLKRETFLEIRAYNINVMMNVQFKFMSHAHFLENLEELQKVQCCKGIINKMFAKRCKGFITFNTKHQGLEKSVRCKVCKKVWDNTIKRPRQPRQHTKLLQRLHSVKLSAKDMKFLKKKIKSARRF